MDVGGADGRSGDGSSEPEKKKCMLVVNIRNADKLIPIHMFAHFNLPATTMYAGIGYSDRGMGRKGSNGNNFLDRCWKGKGGGAGREEGEWK